MATTPAGTPAGAPARTLAAAAPAGIVRSEQAWAIFRRLMDEPDARRHPEPHYAALHALGEAFELPDGTVLAVSHRAVGELVREPAFIRGVGKGRYRPPFSRTTPEQDAELFELGSDVGPMLTATDPPDHARQRELVARAFMPRHVRAMEAVIVQQVDALLAAMPGRGPVDLIADFAAPFAPAVMARMIGLPPERRDEVARLSAAFMAGIDPGCDFAARKASVLAGRGKRDIIREVIAARRASPSDDLVGELVEAADSAQIAERELVGLLQVLYLGGYETTTHMIGNGMVRLLDDREAYARLGQDPAFARPVVEEVLRLDAAIAMTKQVADENASLLGRPLAPGTAVLGMFGAANRDPLAYPDPDAFRPGRKGPPHLSFGGGIHHCIGAHLARFELATVFATLAARYPHMALAAPPERMASFMQRAWLAVEVSLQPEGLCR